MREHIRVLALIGLSSLAIGCGSESDDEGSGGGGGAGGAGGTGEQSSAVRACYSDFTADVRKGPNAGLKLEGVLMLYERPEGGVAAAFAPKGQTEEEPTYIEARLADGDITLEFDLPQGRIVGSGPMNGGFDDCPTELTGDLTGPGEGDAGDWVSLECITSPRQCLIRAVVGAVVGATCFAGCSYAGYNDADCNSTCGTNR